jgi:uncharacterized protein YjfI (DUF2170 family)
MAIILFVSDGYGGYGDFLFGLKTLAGLKNHLKTIDYNEPIYLATQSAGKEKILALGGDKEFDIEIKTIEEIKQLQKNQAFCLDCYMEGPVFNPNIYNKSAITNPIVLLPEYSIDEGVELARDRYVNSGISCYDIVYSGFNAIDLKEKNHRGVLLTQALIEVAEKKESGDFSFRVPYWKYLAKYSPKILEKHSLDTYHETTDLFFDYSHISPSNNQNIYHSNHRQHYLQMQALFAKQSSKSQDILLVSGDAFLTMAALVETFSQLKQNGFNKIIYVNLDTGDTDILFNDKMSDPLVHSSKPLKIYRLLHVSHLTHQEMIATLALSEDLVGVTGDQSLGEALSAKKLVVYECLSHKKELAEGLIEFFKINAKHEKTTTLLKTLIKQNIDNLSENERDSLFDPNIISDYKATCDIVHQYYDLSNPIIKTVESIILNTRLEIIIKEQDKKSLNELLLFLLKEKKFFPLEKLLSNCISNLSEQNHIWILESLLTCTANFKIDVPRWDQFPLLSNFLSDDCFLGKIDKAYLSIIFAYHPKSSFISNQLKLKRQKEINFLNNIHIMFFNNFKDTMIKYALVGGLLFIRKSILSESNPSKSHLLNVIEAQLKILDINPDDEKVKEIAFWELRKYTEQSYIFSEDLTFVNDFQRFSGLNFVENFSYPLNSPLDLKDYHIKRYQEILCESQQNFKEVLKISRKDPCFAKYKLPFSILKYSKIKGFYILGHGEGAILGQGGWGKVKQAYYCDEMGVIHPKALAIKIEKEKDKTQSLREISFFRAAYPHKENYLYQHALFKNNYKNYSIFPKLPGISLEDYLSDNLHLTLKKRLGIAISVLKELKELHSKEIAHLDLKPKNILFDPRQERAYLIDFGCSEKFKEKISLVDNGMLDYMPPEFLRGNCIANHALDVYSCVPLIGLILGIPYSKLIGIKLRTSLGVIENESIQAAIRDCFTQKISIGEAFYQLPNYCYSDRNFNEFVEKFNTSPFDFSMLDSQSVDEDLIETLNQMADVNSEKRPTIEDIIFALDLIMKTSPDPESAENLLKK